MFFFFGLVISITLINNLLIFIKPKLLDKKCQYLINLSVCFLQSVIIVVDGFYFRYLQGLSLTFYVNVNKLTKAFDWGGYFEYFTLEFILKLQSSDNVLFGVNLITLVLGISLLFQFKDLKTTDLPPSNQ
jgi:hypothetical protein